MKKEEIVKKAKEIVARADLENEIENVVFLVRNINDAKQMVKDSEKELQDYLNEKESK